MAVPDTSTLAGVEPTSGLARRGPVGRALTTASWRRAAAIAGVAFALCYWDVLGILVSQWSSNDAYAHGYLIPFISAGLVWAGRQKLYAAAYAPRPLIAAIFLAVGIAVLLAGRMTGVVGLLEVSILPVVAGLIVLLLGTAAVRVLALPLAFLIFMMPVWDIVTDRLHSPFQQLSATLGASLLRVWGVPVHHEGTYLQLPSITLEVAKVCSGVNYLVAVLAVAIPLACLSFTDRSRRLTLIAIAAGVAVLANSLRVALIGFLAYHGLSQALHGPGHVLQGIFVAVIGYVAILVGLAFLRRTEKTPDVAEVLPDLSAYRDDHPVTIPWAAVAIAPIALLTIASLDSRPTTRFKPSSVPSSAWLPTEVGGWRAKVSGFDAHAAFPAVPQDIPWRPFERNDHAAMHVYLGAYSNAPRPGEVSGNWTDVFGSFARAVTLGGGSSKELRANYAIIKRNGTEAHYLYWYASSGSATADRVKAKLHEMWYRLSGRGQEPVVVVIATHPRLETQSQAFDDLARFSEELWRILADRLTNSAIARPDRLTLGSSDSGGVSGSS